MRTSKTTYTKIPNKLYDALIAFKCNVSMKDFVFAIILETGDDLSVGKKIPTSRLCELLKVSDGRIRTVRRRLIDSGMVFYKKGVYTINQNSEDWIVSKSPANGYNIAKEAAENNG